MLTKEERTYIDGLERVAAAARWLLVAMASHNVLSQSIALRDNLAQAIDDIDAVTRTRPSMGDLGDLERYRLTQAQLWANTDIPALWWRDKVAGEMQQLALTLYEQGRLTEDEAHSFTDGIDYIRGMGQGL